MIARGGGMTTTRRRGPRTDWHPQARTVLMTMKGW
jgi:hypothetical protein